MVVRRFWIALACAGLMALAIGNPAFAYGKENWQTAFAGTATTPGGVGFGFWGWCTFGGGVTSGTDGDCEFAQYIHNSPQGSFTCHESLDISAWKIGASPAPGVPGDFVITGTVKVTPTSQTAACLAIFPGTTSSSFTSVDAGIPAAAGHYDLKNVFLGPDQVGEFQIQVTQLP